jgi:DNA polymerase-3 subunit epsilon
MLSKRLYGRRGRHDLASLVERHAPDSATPRHQALPDAQALHQVWQAFHREHSGVHIETAIRELLAGPVLPAGLDSALLDRLPDKPGVYVLRGTARALHVGRAGNLRLQLTNLFRLDRISSRSAAWIDSIVDITWQVASGDLGARLQRAAILRAVLPRRHRPGSGETCSWRFDPQARPALMLEPLSDRAESGDDSFGIFRTERKARNALTRLAARHQLCRTLLGLPVSEDEVCGACLCESDAGKRERLRHLMQACAALLPWKIAPWPYAGPIAIRERRDLHVVDRWRYLGTAQSMPEAHALLENQPPAFDADIYAILLPALFRLPRRRMAVLAGFGP